MDIKKCGEFISEQRKQKGMTQQELADKLFVTNKAVSKWENGRGFPDSSLLVPLAEALSVSVTELVNGEKSVPENAQESADRAIVNVLTNKRDKIRAVITLSFCGIALIISVVLELGWFIGNDIPPYSTVIAAIIQTAAVGLGLKCVSERILKTRITANISVPVITAALACAADCLTICACADLGDPERIIFGIIAALINMAFALAGGFAAELALGIAGGKRWTRLAGAAALPVLAGGYAFYVGAFSNVNIVGNNIAPDAARGALEGLLIMAIWAVLETVCYFLWKLSGKYKVVRR